MSEIKHEWNGTVLTVISDSGASSADLKGEKGDTGPRGPQGPGGIIYDEDGNVIVDLSGYYSKSEVDNLIENVEADVDLSNYATKTELTEAVTNIDLSDYATKSELTEAVTNIDLSDYYTKNEVDTAVSNVEVDLTGYATENYVTTEIAKAQLEGADIDTSGFVMKGDLSNYPTKEEMSEAVAGADIAVDGTTIIKNADGTISSALGGGVNTTDYHFAGVRINLGPEMNQVGYPANKEFALHTTYSYTIVPETGANEEGSFVLTQASSTMYTTTLSLTNGCTVSLYYNPSTGKLFLQVTGNMIIVDFFIWKGTDPAVQYIPINANFIPVDGVTIIIQDGKLCAVGGASLESSEEVGY